MRSLRLTLVLAAAGIAGALSAAERPLVVDRAQSRIDVAVKATMDSFVARLAAYEPEISVAETGAIIGARLAFHFRDVMTGKDGRDKAMHKWQETQKYPDGLFVLTALQPGEGGQATASGRLTLHGVARDVTFPVSIHRDGARYALDGEVPVDTREFGLPGIRMFAVLKVDPVVHVRFHLQGTTEPGAKVARARR